MPQDIATEDKVYLDYTQAELDWQYDHSKRFPDNSIFQAERGEASERARQKLNGLLNVPYGDHPDEVVDIFPAAGGGKSPVIVFFHGGAWTRGSKDGYSFPAAEFVPRGVAWVATEFTRVPNGTLGNQVRQNRDAVAWVYNNADEYGFDRDRIYIAGHSSGGHMCGMVLVTDWEKSHGLPGDLIKGATAISGLSFCRAASLAAPRSFWNMLVSGKRFEWSYCQSSSSWV